LEVALSVSPKDPAGAGAIGISNCLRASARVFEIPAEAPAGSAKTVSSKQTAPLPRTTTGQACLFPEQAVTLTAAQSFYIA
jgi:hypothetical protein